MVGPILVTLVIGRLIPAAIIMAVTAIHVTGHLCLRTLETQGLCKPVQAKKDHAANQYVGDQFHSLYKNNKSRDQMF